MHRLRAMLKSVYWPLYTPAVKLCTHLPPLPSKKVPAFYKVLYVHVITNMNTMWRSASTQHAIAVGIGTRCMLKNNDTNKMSTLYKMNVSDVGNLLTST